MRGLDELRHARTVGAARPISKRVRVQSREGCTTSFNLDRLRGARLSRQRQVLDVFEADSRGITQARRNVGEEATPRPVGVFELTPSFRGYSAARAVEPSN